MTHAMSELPAARSRGRLGGPPRFRLFKPILAGANVRDRMIACIGAILGIGFAGLMSTLLAGGDLHLPLLAAPLGASAVLVFALPASPIAQPWPVIAGNTISALSGIAVSHVVHEPMLAAAFAVGLAVAAMSLTRSLHPPGGGMALTTVLSSSSIGASGFMFALVPVCLNSALLALLAWAFHKFSGHSYPHRVSAVASQAGAPAFDAIDVDSALTDMGETFDISRADLDRLLLRAEQNANARRVRGDNRPA